jgi:ATP-binding cassette subfamily B protein
LARHDGAGLRVGFWAAARQLPRLVLVCLRLAAQAGRRALLAVLAAEVGGGLATMAGLLATNAALGHLLAAGPPRTRAVAAIPALTVLALAGSAGSLLRAVSHAARGRLGPRVDRLAYTRLLERAVAVELATVQDAGFHAQIAAARRGAMSARKALDGVIGLVNALVGLLAVTGVLSVLHPLLLALLATGVLPKVWGAVRCARARYESYRGWLEVNRQLDLLAGLLTDHDTATEVRAYQIGPYLIGQYRRLSAAAEREQARLSTVEARTTLLADALAGVAAVATYGTLAALLLAGIIPLPAAGTAVVALTTSAAKLTELAGRMNDLYEDGLFITDWERACAACADAAVPSGGRPAPDRPTVLTARGVGFRYPGATRPALSGVDVTVRRGEVVALVGENGSGKSTLVNLLTGLYLPTEGTVSWDGIPVRQFDRSTMLDRVALVPQDFVQWPFTARMNVAIGRPDLADRQDLLDAAAATGGATGVVGGLPGGWDTLLAREYWGGTSLSGGQWQRIGLARGWFRDAPILVLDEPTAALDPRAEVDVFDRVSSMAGAGCAVLLITHRLASVRTADRIYVLHGGAVVEQGSHAELLAAGGDYARTYRLQAAQFA